MSICGMGHNRGAREGTIPRVARLSLAMQNIVAFLPEIRLQCHPMKNTTCPLLLLLLLLLAIPFAAVIAEPAIREWTNEEGRTIAAELIAIEGETATLRLQNRRTYEVSLATLSEADREFADQWRERKGAAEKANAMGLKRGKPTEAIVESAFSEDIPATRKGEIAGWKAGIGEWRVEGGALVGDELPEDNHASSLTYRLEASHLIILAEVQLGTAEQIAFACRDTVPPNLHLARLYITPDKLWIQHMSGIAKTTKAEKLVTKEVSLDPEEWYPVTIEIIGDRYRARVGDNEIEATHSRFADAKGIVALVNRGKGARFRNVSLWRAEPEEE